MFGCFLDNCGQQKQDDVLEGSNDITRSQKIDKNGKKLGKYEKKNLEKVGKKWEKNREKWGKTGKIEKRGKMENRKEIK